MGQQTQVMVMQVQGRMLTSLRAGQREQQVTITALLLSPLRLLMFLERKSLSRRTRGHWLVIVRMPTLPLLSGEPGNLFSTQLLQRGLPSEISLSNRQLGMQPKLMALLGFCQTGL